MEPPTTTIGSPSSTRTASTSTTAFRLNCGQLFLTYPKCPIDPLTALPLLEAMLDFEEYVIAQELHEDGEKHLHVYLRRGQGKKWNIRDPRRLDLSGHHGNYQSVRNANAVKKYVTKDGNYVTNMTMDSTPTNPYQRLLATPNLTMEEALKVLSETPQGARDLILHRDQIMKTLQAMRPRETEIKYSLQDFPGWTIDWPVSTVLILSGPTNTGKTALAKALLAPRPLFVTHLDTLKIWDPELYSGVIYDEANLKHLPRESQIHHLSLDESLDLHSRYRPAYLTAGRKVVFTTNLHPCDILNWDCPAIRRRCTVVFVHSLGVYEKQ